MSKKKLSKMKSIPVMHISGEQVTLMKMPKYNPYSIGHGVHGDVKYNRKKVQKETKRIISEW